ALGQCRLGGKLCTIEVTKNRIVYDTKSPWLPGCHHLTPASDPNGMQILLLFVLPASLSLVPNQSQLRFYSCSYRSIASSTSTALYCAHHPSHPVLQQVWYIADCVA